MPLLVTLGFASGATAVGFIGQQLIAAVGARGLFWSAGPVSAVTAILLPLFLPPERGALARSLFRKSASFTAATAFGVTTGVGWASALGKAGSIAGPSAGGLLLGLGASASASCPSRHGARVRRGQVNNMPAVSPANRKTTTKVIRRCTEKTEWTRPREHWRPERCARQ